MPRTSKEITSDAQQLKKLIPSYADTTQVFASAKHAEKHGDKKALAKDRRIGAHLLRLEKLLSHEGVESRAWDSAVKELIIERSDIPESFWKQQLQILRDNGQGSITYVPENQKNEITEQLQDAQRTGLESWRNYLEQTGDQYPLWFKLYAWEGMSGLGVFDQQKQRFRKRSKDTVAPYPQLNPAVLAKVYDMVTESEKTEPFNTLYSRLLVEQKASMPTPENPEDVRGEWHEYTSDDIEAITHAAQATPWCIAGQHYAESYTKNGGKFLLFHLQDPETGVYSPTACASIRLDGRGEVVELSGLKGGSSQYLEDGLISTVEEKVKTLPGGEHYLQAFEDKQKLIAMDRKFQAGEPFSKEELLFLYEIDRPIRYIDTYAHDPRPDEFKRRDYSLHLTQLAEIYGGNEANARLILNPIEGNYQAVLHIKHALQDGVDHDFLLKRLEPTLKLKHLSALMELGLPVAVDELATQIPRDSLLGSFTTLKEHGLTMTIDELAGQFTDKEKITHFRELRNAGLELTADELAAKLEDETRLSSALALKRIGATFDTDELIRKVHGDTSDAIAKGNSYTNWMEAGASPALVLKMIKLNQYYKTKDMHDGLGLSALNTIVRAVPKSGIDQAAFIDQMKQKLADNQAAYLGTGGVRFDYLDAGFDVNVVAKKRGVDGSEYGGNLAKFMELGVDPKILPQALGSYYSSERAAELVEYGCDIHDVVKVIEADNQFDHFDELQELGAGLNIDEVVGRMETKDVLYKITAIKERGVVVNVNEVLKRLESSVYEHTIDDLLAAGADPALIGDKISLRGIVGNDGRFSTYTTEYRKYVRYSKEYPEVYKRVNQRIEELRKEDQAASDERWRKREQDRLERLAASKASS